MHNLTTWTMKLRESTPNSQPWTIRIGSHRFATGLAAICDGEPPFLNLPGPWWPVQYDHLHGSSSYATAAELFTISLAHNPTPAVYRPDLKYLDLRLKMRGFNFNANQATLALGVRCRFDDLPSDFFMTHPIPLQLTSSWEEVRGQFSVTESDDWTVQGFFSGANLQLPSLEIIREKKLLVSSLSLALGPIQLQPIAPELLAHPPSTTELVNGLWPLDESLLPSGSLGLSACALTYSHG